MAFSNDSPSFTRTPGIALNPPPSFESGTHPYRERRSIWSGGGLSTRRRAAVPLGVELLHSHHREAVEGDRMGHLREQRIAPAPPLGDELGPRDDSLVHQGADGRRVVHAHLAGEEGEDQILVAAVERCPQEVVYAAISPLVDGVLGERSTARQDASPEHPLGEVARLLFAPARGEIAPYVEVIGAASGPVDGQRTLGKLDEPVVGDVSRQVFADDSAAFLALGITAKAGGEDAEDGLGRAVAGSEDVPEPLVVGERAGLPRREFRVGPDGDAPRAGGGKGRESARQLDLAALAENRPDDRADPGGALLGVERRPFLARARPARPVPRDLEVLQVLVGRLGEFVARVAEQLDRMPVEVLGAPRGEEPDGRHGLVADAAEQALGAVLAADALPEILELAKGPGRIEAESWIGRLRQLGAALEQEPLVYGAVPRQRPDDADGPLDAAERVAEGAQRFVSARHEDADLGIPAS